MASSHSLKFSTIENIKALLLILFSLLFIKQAFEVTKTIKRIWNGISESKKESLIVWIVSPAILMELKILVLYNPKKENTS